MADQDSTERPHFKVHGDWGDRIEINGIVRESGFPVIAVDILGSRGGHRGRVVLDDSGTASLIQALQHARDWQVNL